MPHWRKIILYALALVLAGGAFAFNQALAITPGQYKVAGNPSCGDLYLAEVISGPGDLTELGPLFGLKYDSNPTGDLSSTLTNNVPWTLTNGSPADPNHSVSIFNVIVSGGEGVAFDWSATLGIDAVIVKARDSNAYVYSPEAFGDSGLTAPDGRAVSHVEFCYDYELDADKTANAEYTATYTWDITKDFDATYDKFIGDPATTHGYAVSVDQTVLESNFAVSGEIYVKNPAPYAVTFSAADVLSDGTAADVSCPTFSLTANDGAIGGTDEVTCTYSAALLAKTDGTNTATVTSDTTYAITVGGVAENVPTGSDVATADYIFGDPTTVVGEQMITVDDDNLEGSPDWTANSDDSWSYNRDFTCPTDLTLYEGDGKYSFTHVNTANIVEIDGKSDTATVTVNCYAPVVTKNASASYDEKWTWTLDKTVDPDQSDFAGNPLNDWTWTVTVDESFVEENFLVGGMIYVNNPAGSPDDMTVSLEDQLNDGTLATVDCGGDATSVTVAPGAQGTCTYTAKPAGRTADLNTATGTFNGITGFVGTAGFAFDKNIVNGTATVTDDEIGLNESLTAGDGGQRVWTAVEGATCSSNPAEYEGDGKYSVTDDNTALLTSNGGQNLQADAATTYTCYAPVVTKDAAASYDERWTWTLDKTVDPDQSEFAGNPLNDWTWTVTVDESFVEENFLVSGMIYVNNPAGSPGNMTVSLEDQLNDSTLATVDCGGDATSVTVAPGAQGTCSYTAKPAGRTADLNTATGTFNGITGFVGTAGFAFDKNVVNGTATVTDDEIGLNESLTAGDGGQRVWTAAEGATCSSNPADYEGDGKYSVTDDNTALLTSNGGQNLQADAATTYTCYAPVVTKDAAASYDERWTWTLDKTVADPVGPFYPGDVPSWTWTVTVDESFVEENFLVSGMIYVNNPAGSPGDMTVSLEDQLNDGTLATVNCGGDATSVTVAPGAQGTCSYTAKPAGRTADLNTATGTFNGITGFVGTAGFAFDKNIVNGTATVDDDQEGDFPVNLIAGDGGTRTWTETQSGLCSSSWADYGADGTYTVPLNNDATLTSELQTLQASANTSYTCEAGTVDVLKTTDGLVDPTEDWQFALYIGPDGFGGTQVGSTSSTLGDADGILNFGDPVPALRPDTTYSVCELNIPAGWSTEWIIGGVTVIPYNPNADDSPPEDLGHRCFDVGAGTSYPITIGQNLRISVDNSFPGGAPRTPGYWKNWSSCTNGGQYDKTTDDVDPDNEYVSLDEVLNDPGVTWDDIADDNLVFNIASCQDAVNILDQRDIVNLDKNANDAAFTLAMHLLAAQLNFGAGACTTQEVLDTALAAEMLLDQYDFNGVVEGKGKNAGYLVDNKNPDKAYALELADYLDRYNNGEFCGNGGD